MYHPSMTPYLYCSVYMRCLFSKKYNDDVSTLSSTPVLCTHPLNAVVPVVPKFNVTMMYQA